MDKLSLEFQRKFSSRLLFDESILERIDPSVKLHDQTKVHPLSSAAVCLNVLGSIGSDPNAMQGFLTRFGLEIEEIIEFPSPASFGGRLYRDKGYVVFEWVGPLKSPIHERGGGRGASRTSVDAFVLARIEGKVTQILIEWKFTEGLSRELQLGRFCGQRGIERLRRYSAVLAALRQNDEIPFDFEDEYRVGSAKSSLGLCDFSPDPLYQLMRITLLAKMSTGEGLGQYTLEDYRILHLTHSQNDRMNILHPEYLIHSPGLRRFSGQGLHDVWKTILSDRERGRFFWGHWDQGIGTIPDSRLREYLSARYG